MNQFHLLPDHYQRVVDMNVVFDHSSILYAIHYSLFEHERRLQQY